VSELSRQQGRNFPQHAQIIHQEKESRMYCPRCGQQLQSETRFCLRCGLPMNAVTNLLANDGQASATKPDPIPSNRGVKFGVKLILLGLLLAPLCLGVSFAVDAGFPLFAPLTVFLAGVLWLVYSAIFREEPIKRGRQAQPEVNAAQMPQLSSPHTFNDSTMRAPDTGEMLTQPSVTDHTTRLLD
jgi:hypothetical protein